MLYDVVFCEDGNSDDVLIHKVIVNILMHIYIYTTILYFLKEHTA